MALKAIVDNKRLFEQILLKASQEGDVTVYSKLDIDDIPNYSAVHTFGEPHRFEFQTCVSKTDKDTLSLSIRCFPGDLSDLTWPLVVKWKVSVINEMTKKSLDFDTITTTLTAPTSEKSDGQFCQFLPIRLCEINDFITRNSILLRWNVHLSSQHETFSPEQESSESCDQQNIKEHIKATLSLAQKISETFSTAQFRDKINLLNQTLAQSSIGVEGNDCFESRIDKADERIDKILHDFKKDTEEVTQCVANWKDESNHVHESAGNEKETSDLKQNSSVLMNKEDKSIDKKEGYEETKKQKTLSQRKRSAEFLGQHQDIKRRKSASTKLATNLGKRSADFFGPHEDVKGYIRSTSELEIPKYLEKKNKIITEKLLLEKTKDRLLSYNTWRVGRSSGQQWKRATFSADKDQRHRFLTSPRRDEEFNDQPQESKRQKISPHRDQTYRISAYQRRRISKKTFEEEIEKFRKSLRDEMSEFKEKILTEVKKDCQYLKDEMNALTTKLSDEKEKDLQYWVDRSMNKFESENKKTCPANDGSLQPQSSFQKEDGANSLTGTIETQLFEKGGPNIEKYLSECKKNPNHRQFVAVSEFNIKHLPKGYYDNDLLEFIKATAQLTVKVEVKIPNEKRPESRPNIKRDNSVDDTRRNNTIRVGTGMLCDVENYTEGQIMAFNKGHCKCPKCQRSANHSTVWGIVRMISSTDVVYEETAARHTKCRLFYDKPDSPVVTLDGWEVEEANPEKGWIALKCVTCDVDLLDKLDQMWKNWRHNLLDKVNLKYKSSRDIGKLAFIVSHPHGYRKKISVGKWIKKNEVGVGWVSYTYTTCTCPGSSGAYVHLLGYNGWDYRGRSVHRGVDSEGNNYSCAGVKFD